MNRKLDSDIAIPCTLLTMDKEEEMDIPGFFSPELLLNRDKKTGEAIFCRVVFPHLKTRKPKPSKEAMLKIKELKWPTEYSVEIADLDRLIKKYKFKEALPMVEALQNKLKGYVDP